MAAPAAGLEAMRAYAATGGVGAVELGQLCALRESAEALSTTLAGVPETRDAALTVYCGPSEGWVLLAGVAVMSVVVESTCGVGRPPPPCPPFPFPWPMHPYRRASSLWEPGS